MAALHSLRLPPLSVSQARVSQGRSLVKFGEARAGRAHTGAGSASACRGISRGIVRSASGSAMREDEVEDGEVGSRGNGAAEGVAEERPPIVVVSFYKFANLPDYEQKRAPLKELCEKHVRVCIVDPWG